MNRSIQEISDKKKPSRHYGVLLLYGQHLALNHLVARNEIRIVIGHNLLDQSTTDKSTQYLQQSPRLNLHCWHTNERFSKFAFKMGHYNQTDLAMYRNDTTAQAYVRKLEEISNPFDISSFFRQ